jgi:hypothetical protein
MRFYDATEALIITTGKLTRKAKELCDGTGVVFYDGHSLLALCQKQRIVLPSWCALRHLRTGDCSPIGKRMVIGRQEGCEVRVPDDATVSRRHCELKWSGLALSIRDLSSSNGTRINGQCVPSSNLNYGDRIEAGQQAWQVMPLA